MVSCVCDDRLFWLRSVPAMWHATSKGRMLHTYSLTLNPPTQTLQCCLGQYLYPHHMLCSRQLLSPTELPCTANMPKMNVWLSWPNLNVLHVVTQWEDLYTVEPLYNQDTLKWGHLNKHNTFCCPKHPVCVHYNSWNQDTSPIGHHLLSQGCPE